MPKAVYVEVPVFARDGSVKGRFKIDPEDAVWVTEHRWKFGPRGHVVRNKNHNSGEKFERLHLARVILGLEKGGPLTADHINRDPTDNRRCNLRVIPAGAQAQNRLHRGKSPYRGVHRRGDRYRAMCCLQGHIYHLGTYDDELEAARVARAFRLKHMPYAVD